MKKTLISLALAVCTSFPSLYAFHDQSTDHLVSGEPVMFIVTGPKFSPASYDAVRTAIGRYYSSDCFMSQQNNLDVTVDQEGNATIVMRWATKEAFVHDQKIECDALNDLRMSIGKLGGVKPTDLKFKTVTSIASSPR